MHLPSANLWAGLSVLKVCRAARRTPIPAAGRPAKAFYLNEEQALLVAMFSRTEKAKEVRATLVRVFAAYRRGDLVPAAPAFQVPQTFAEALRLAADNAALGTLA